MSFDRKITVKLRRNENLVTKHVVLEIFHNRTTHGDLKPKHRLMLDENGIENRAATFDEIALAINDNVAKNYADKYVSVKNSDNQFVVIDKTDLDAALHALTIPVALPDFIDAAVFDVSNTRVENGARIKSFSAL